MSTNDAKQRLLDVLDRKAFDPVINADPGDYATDEREQLRDVQETTRSTKQSYHEYGSADKVRQMFRDDLSSDSARKVQRQIGSLGLPTLQDVKDEFERVADEVGVGS